MNERVARLLNLARETLDAARYTLDGGYVRQAVNSAYYAGYYAAKAVLLTVPVATKTHTGLQAQFRLHFVQTGRIDDEQAVVFAKALQLRQEAAYDDGALIRPAQAAQLIADVDAFVQTVEVLLNA